MKLQYFVILILVISSCKVFNKPADTPYITEFDVTITCIDSIQSVSYLNEIDSTAPKLTTNVFTIRDINNAIDYVAIFNGVEQYHDVDILARMTIDSLTQLEIDTILYFRDWPHTNGFNGYGKLIWKKSGIVQQIHIEFDDGSSPVRAKFTSKQDSTLNNALNYYLKANIHSDKCTPEVTKFVMSHIGNYFVYSRLSVSENCFMMSTVDVGYFNRHPKSNFIRRVRVLPY